MFYEMVMQRECWNPLPVTGRR